MWSWDPAFSPGLAYSSCVSRALWAFVPRRSRTPLPEVPAMVPRLHPKSQTHTGGASVGLFFPWGPATPLSGGPKCPPALLYQWHEGLRPQGLERGYLPSVCVWGGESMCIFHSSQGVIHSRMDGVFKANGPEFTPVGENSSAPTKAHGSQECGVARQPPRLKLQHPAFILADLCSPLRAHRRERR